MFHIVGPALSRLACFATCCGYTLLGAFVQTCWTGFPPALAFCPNACLSVCPNRNFGSRFRFTVKSGGGGGGGGGPTKRSCDPGGMGLIGRHLNDLGAEVIVSIGSSLTGPVSRAYTLTTKTAFALWPCEKYSTKNGVLWV